MDPPRGSGTHTNCIRGVSVEKMREGPSEGPAFFPADRTPGQSPSASPYTQLGSMGGGKPPLPYSIPADVFVMVKLIFPFTLPLRYHVPSQPLPRNALPQFSAPS